jgi:serine/threonine-protein kinase
MAHMARDEGKRPANELQRDRLADRFLGEALDLPPAERAAFLEGACAGDPELLERARRLLRLAEGGDGLLGGGAALRGELGARLAAEGDDRDLVGRQVDRYRLLEPLGRGGAATVYLAERTDGSFEQRVAIKILRSAEDEAADIVRRFEQERQILAALEHPHVARLLDGGTTDWGHPFLVVEFVDGVPIDRYCDEQRLSLRRRLLLFLDVVDAVQHAHRRLIVHRDIKPSNILVTGNGQVKLLDFGIAKLLDPTDFAHAAPRTRTASLWLTPRYASPEQLLGGPVTTAADVYQLGVLLYELLTGRAAFESTTPTPAALVAAARARTSVRPSALFTHPPDDADGRQRLAALRGLSPAALVSRLRGELDDVVMTATRAEPERRYESAALLARDVRDFLAGRPVSARGDSLGYRLRKFAGRHRLGVAVAGVLLAGVAASGVAVTWGFLRAERERARAEAIGEFLKDTLRGANPYVAQGRDTELLEAILDDAATRIDADLSGQPWAAADMHSTIAQTYYGIAKYDEALEHAEAAVRGFSAEVGPNAPETLWSRNLLGLVYWDLGRTEEAEPLLERVVADAMSRLGPEHRTTIDAVTNLGLVIRAQGRPADAEPYYRQAMEFAQEALGPSDEITLSTTSNLSFLLDELDRRDEAEALARTAADRARDSLGMDHPDTLLYIDKLATIIGRQGRPEEALPLHLEALAGMKRVFGERHSTTLGSAYNLATVQRNLGRYDDALATLRGILPVLIDEYGAESRFVYLTRNQIGQTLVAAGRPAEAIPELTEARRVAAINVGPEHYHNGVIAVALAEAWIDSGGPSRALPLLAEARRLFEATFGGDGEHSQLRELQRVEAKLARGGGASG